MAFDVNTITLQGAIAVASATVSNKLVIDGCDATTDVLTQAQAAQIATRPATPGSTTTEIALAGSTDNHVFAYAEFLLGESTGGDFNSFFLYGHLEDDTSTVFVISVCSSTNPVHLPASGDVTNRTEIQFDLTFTPNAEVVKVADTSMYCTRGEFLILKERAVTTHAEGTPTTGEAQDIYGVKTFKDGFKTDSVSPATTNAKIDFPSGIKTDVINPHSSAANALVEIPRIKSSSIVQSEDMGIYVSPDADNNSTINLFHNGSIAGLRLTTCTNGTTKGWDFADGKIVSTTTGCSIGAINDGIENIYVRAIENDNTGAGTSASKLFITGHSAAGDDVNDFTAQLTIGRYDSTATHVGFEFSGYNPNTNNISSFVVTGYSVGTSSKPVGAIYANKLISCVLPSFQTGNNVELGAILFIRIVADANVTLYAGTDIIEGQSQTKSGVTITPETYFAAIDVTASGVFISGGGDTGVSTGTMWRLLSTAFMTSFVDSGVTKYQGYALAMRIE